MYKRQLYASAHSFFYLGRGHAFPLALEGALKLKEISYIHAEGYASGEMKHGPIALIEPEFPTFALAFNDALFPKVKSNIVEVQARRGPVIALANPGADLHVEHLWTCLLYTSLANRHGHIVCTQGGECLAGLLKARCV